MLISVVIPCYNSSKTLGTVVKDIKHFFDGGVYEYQIILVNDCSPDNTMQVISQICENDSKILGIDLTKNYGQASAIMASVNYIKGDIAVFMDDDGQHPADEMYKLIDKINEGFDLVYARFPNKKHSAFKRITSKMNQRMLEATNRKPKGIDLSSYFAISKTAILALKNYKSPFPSAGAYLLQITRKICNVDITHKERLYGSSNYTLKKLLRLWLQGITNFSIAPLRISSQIGAGVALIGIIAAIIIIIRKIINPNIVVGYTSLISVFLFLGGLIMLMLGIIGEYIGRMYMLLSNMPQYEIRTIINLDEKEKDE